MINGISIQRLAHVEVNHYNYCVYVSICPETASIHIFKYNASRCLYEVFTTQREAQQFIEQPLL